MSHSKYCDVKPFAGSCVFGEVSSVCALIQAVGRVGSVPDLVAVLEHLNDWYNRADEFTLSSWFGFWFSSPNFDLPFRP